MLTKTHIDPGALRTIQLFNRSPPGSALFGNTLLADARTLKTVKIFMESKRAMGRRARVILMTTRMTRSLTTPRVGPRDRLKYRPVVLAKHHPLSDSMQYEEFTRAGWTASGAARLLMLWRGSSSLELFKILEHEHACPRI